MSVFTTIISIFTTCFTGALNILNNFVSNSVTGPFFKMLLAVLAIVCAYHYLLEPLLKSKKDEQ